MTGRSIAHFEILEQIGEGGMGVVYKARDTKLTRIVALKVLSAGRLNDPARRSRFVQEAQAASALNHPNIVTIYEIQHQDGVDAIAMEFIKGQTLESLAGRKGLPLGDVLKYGLQVADALTAAHAAGIVHRDLKPGNVMVTDAGLVKVLDFGLAKLTEPLAGDQRATLSMRPGEAETPRTEEGALLGTVAYMSPEQAEGKKVDGRSDIFSFGAMLYEMVTGRRAFQGDSNLSILTAILRQDPRPPSQLGEPVPRDLERIIARCLRKDPARRFQHMDDLKVAIEELKEESESGALLAGVPAPAPAAPARRWLLSLVAGLALAMAAGVGTVWWMNRSRKPAAPGQLRRLTFDSGMTVSPAISPDGKLVAYASDRAGDGKLDIWLQQVAGGDAVRLTRLPQDENRPAFSPDGSRVVFCSHAPQGGLYVVSTLGGEPRKIIDGGHDARFSPDGNGLVYWKREGAAQAMFVAGQNGENPRRLAQDFFNALEPVWSPDGKHIVFIGSREERGPLADGFDWWVVPAGGGAPARTGVLEALRRQGIISDAGSRAPPGAWMANRVLFSAGSVDTQNLWQVALNSKTWQPDSPARQLTFGAGREIAPSVAAGGALVFEAAITNMDFWSLPLEANTGKPAAEVRQLTRNSASDSFAALTADGKTMMFCSNKGGNSDVWKKDLETGAEAAVVATPASEHLFGMSLDGSKLLVGRTEQRHRALYLASPTAGASQKVCEGCMGTLSPDGARVFYAEGSLREARDIFVLEAATGQRVQVLKGAKDLCSPCLSDARFAPDGQWGAFAAAVASDSPGLVLVPFRNRQLLESEAVWVSRRRGDGSPYWSPDGNLLYYLSDQDGYRCVWAQRLEPAAKKPAGEAFPVHHFHSPNRFARPRHLSVARDKLVVGLTEGSSNIYLTKLPE